MTDMQVNQSPILTAYSATTGMLKIPQAYPLAVYNIPAKNIAATQADLSAVVHQSAAKVAVSQGVLMAVVRGRLGNARVRSWGFSLDGHDFYVLRLGNIETLVYDCQTGAWSTFDDGGLPVFRAPFGVNWGALGQVPYQEGATSNVVCGDDSFGYLYTLAPERGYDDNGLIGAITPSPIIRQVVGGLPERARDRMRNNGVWLTASMGAPAIEGSGVLLETSDDQGNSWTSQGTILIQTGVFTQTLPWRSLGVIYPPGRLFRFTDQSAVYRIDGMDVDVSIPQTNPKKQ